MLEKEVKKVLKGKDELVKFLTEEKKVRTEKIRVLEEKKESLLREFERIEEEQVDIEAIVDIDKLDKYLNISNKDEVLKKIRKIDNILNKAKKEQTVKEEELNQLIKAMALEFNREELEVQREIGETLNESIREILLQVTRNYEKVREIKEIEKLGSNAYNIFNVECKTEVANIDMLELRNLGVVVHNLNYLINNYASSQAQTNWMIQENIKALIEQYV